MTDRSKRPDFKITTGVKLPQINKTVLSRDIPLIYINGGNEEIIRLLIVFKAGTWHQKKRLVASTTLKMLTEGTQDKSAEQISEIINFYGAELKHRRGTHNSYLMLTVLNKHLEPLLRILNEILTKPVFPENELKIYLENQLQEYLIELENVDVVARNLFHAAVFGFEHPYGTYALPEDFNRVTRDDLVEFFTGHLHLKKMKLYAGGQVGEREINLIDKYLTGIRDGKLPAEPQYEFSPSDEKYIYQPKENSLQSAIQIGNRTINIHHPDYPYLHFAIVLLGGYFGSRLMTNIREEKGLTYGIYASFDNYPLSGLINIEASVRKENRDLVIDEIRKEIKLLKEKGADEQELVTVKNYVLSQLLKLINGIFPVTHYIMHLHNNNLDETFVENYVKAINSIDNRRLIETVEKYLCFDDFYKVVVG